MKKGIFVTATGTDVGKTYISALLVSSLRSCGINASYYKPILSGAVRDGATLIPSDCAYVKEFANLADPLGDLVTYAFEESLSPHLAAQRASRKIELAEIANDFARACERCDYLVVEGCGGIACPIYENEEKTLMLEDVIKSIDFETVIVSSSGLGSVNSAVLAVTYARNKGIKVKGVIMNMYEHENFLHEDNKRMIIKLTGCPVLACVGHGIKSISWEM